jgi:hypothetical protein
VGGAAIGEVRRGQKQEFRSGGIDGHGSPLGNGSYSQCPIQGKNVSRIPAFFR